MLKTKLIALATVAAFMVLPTAVLADAPKVSYSAKKQGRVVFQQDTQEETSSPITNKTISPSEIEPAAGDQEPAVSTGNSEENALSESMKLPRKN